MAIITLGGLWKKKMSSGVGYYKGMKISVENLLREVPQGTTELSFGIFQVREKKSDKSPDLSLVIFIDDEQGQAPSERPHVPPEEDIPF